MSILERPVQTVKPAARKPRKFGDGILPDAEAPVDVREVRRMMLGLGLKAGEHQVLRDEFERTAWSMAFDKKPASVVEEAAATAALAALKAFRAAKSAPVVDDAPLPRSRRFEPTEAEWEAACAMFRGDTSGQEYAEWADQTDREWDAACPAEVLSEACEMRGGGVGHPA